MLVTGAVVSLGVSVGLQVLALSGIKTRCLAPIDRPVSTCIGDEPGIVAAGATSAVLAATSVGLAAGGGWELGVDRRPRRLLQVLGGLGVGLGLSAVIGSRVAQISGPVCEDPGCADERLVALAIRNIGVFAVASGAATLTAHARSRRVLLSPTRYAGGFGLTLTVQW